MRVSELYLYPIKSARGIRLERAQLDARGLAHDRRWMLVDADGVFISQREAHRMALIDVALTADTLVVNAPDMEPLPIPLTAEGPALPCRIWQDTVTAIAVGNEADAWFTGYLGFPCRLVYMPDTTRRIVDRDWVTSEHVVGFADGFPLLLIGTGSLDELNRRLLARGEAAVEMRRFRPNIVITPTEPFEEDEWRHIRIGALDVDVVKPCARCVITTVDVATGTAGKEPLRTLAGFRKGGSHVYFGQNAVHRQPGEIAVGDAVQIVSRRG